MSSGSLLPTFDVARVGAASARMSFLGRTSQPASRPVVLYSRAGCHLCEEAKALLEKYRSTHALAITVVDIDADPALCARYDACVPVVEIEGKVRFRGVVNETLLVRLLKAGCSGAR
jgi:glutaredoxin